MRQIFAERTPGFQVNPRAQIESVHLSTKNLFAESVIAVNVDDVASVYVQWANGELIAQQSEFACRGIETGLNPETSALIL